MALGKKKKNLAEIHEAMRKSEQHRVGRAKLRELILGGQDGVVNVLGLVLGVASATNDTRIVIISGLAAAFAESISMAAVAYSSSRAEEDYYDSELAKENSEIEKIPEVEKQEIREIYEKMGFTGKTLEQIVKKITSKKELWLKVMMREELELMRKESESPKKDAVIVGISSMIGSIIPIIPFFLMPVVPAAWWALLLGVASLFAAGAIKARLTVGKWWKSGLEMAIIGGVAAVLGYAVGSVLGAMHFG